MSASFQNRKSSHMALVQVLALLCLATLTAASITQAATVSYTLDNVTLLDGRQLTGSFDWTYPIDDFEGGAGQFSSLFIPYTTATLENGGLTITIETKSIEITSVGNNHDDGLDITLRLPSALSPSQPTDMDVGPGASYFECCGNGFKSQYFISGTISPVIPIVPPPASLWRYAMPPYLERQ